MLFILRRFHGTNEQLTVRRTGGRYGFNVGSRATVMSSQADGRLSRRRVPPLRHSRLSSVLVDTRAAGGVMGSGCVGPAV